MTQIETLQIAQRAFNTPLMLDPAKAVVIARHLGPRFLHSGGTVDVVGFDGATTADHMAPRAASLLGDEVHQFARRRQSYSVVQGVAVIPIVGTLVRRGSFTGQSSGTTSYEGISAQLRAAAEDDAVRVIALEIDSFGGEAAGIFALGETIREVRMVKPVRAFVADYALSAGYAIASQADHITIPPFGDAGSIGVVMMHVDYEQKLEQDGIKVSLIHSGAEKVAGNPFEALPAEVRDRLQAQGDVMRESFAQMVAAGRRDVLSAAEALATEARTYRGQAAVDAGLADAVAEARTAFAALLEEVSPRVQPIGGRVASVQPIEGSAAVPAVPGIPLAAAARSEISPGAGLAARAETPAGAASAAKETPMDWESLTTAQLREQRADLVSEIEAAATAEAETEKATAVSAAVTEERARIAAIDEIAMDGHDSLVAAAKADGRSAEQLAVDMIKAEKAAGGTHLATLKAGDAAAAVPATPSSEPVTSGQSQGGTPEEQAEAMWDSDPKLRAEFRNNKADYLAFTKAETSGNARIMHRVS